MVQQRAISQVDQSLIAASDRVLADLDQSEIGASGFTQAPGPDQNPSTDDPDERGGTPPGTALEVDVRDAADLPVGGPRTIQLDGESYRTLVRALPDSGDQTGRTVGFYRSLEDVQATVRVTAWALGAAALLASLLAIGFVLLIVRRALGPLGEAHAASQQIAESGDLSIRIPVGRPDEVGLLARTMNSMLERLQGTQARLSRTLDEQRRFTADASHELRTPLTALRGDIDFLRAHDPPAEEREAILGDMTEAAERMGRMAEGLLSLARLDAGVHAERAPVDIQELLDQILSEDEPLHITRAARKAATLGDPDGLRGIFSNLVENARRYGGAVSVSVDVQPPDVVVRVSDDGPGIAKEDRERIFDRFFRARDVRNVPGGAGLGLAIARGAAEVHCGTLTLLDAEPGAHFEVRLPLAEAN